MATARKAPLRAVKVAAPIYQLRIELLDVHPLIWRRVLVPGSIKLHKLHAVLLWTMGWAGGHLHEFVIGHDHYGEPDPDFDTPPRVQREERFTLAAALGARKSFIYLYDFGDGWEHTIKIERLIEAVPGVAYPRLIDATGRCPPEDIGGPWGYGEFLEAIADPGHERHTELTEWIGEAFDPTAVDTERHAHDLATLAKQWSRKPAVRRRRTT